MNTFRSSRTAIYASTLVLALFVPACAPKPPDTGTPEVKPIPVTVASVKTVGLRRTVPVVGTLLAFEDVQLAPKVMGRVARVFKDLGDRVAPGEVLLELDSTEYRLAVEQARPAFEGELRKLKLDKLPATDAEFERHLPKIDAVAQAKANLELSEKDLKRTETEMSRGVGSAQTLDSAVTRVKVLQTGVLSAETDARVTLANARRLKAALEDAERKLADTKLCAPIPDEWTLWEKALGATTTPLKYGVALKMVSVGEMVQQTPVTNCYRLVIDHSLKLAAPVPEKHAEVAIGQAVEIRVEAHPDRVFTGIVTRVSPTVDATTRTFGIVVAVLNGDGRLKAGGFARAEVVTRVADAVLTVPAEAVVTFAGVTKVYLAEGDVAKSVEVEVGTRDKDWVEVRGQLTPGARVITSGQSQLVDGSPIRIR